MMWMFFLTGSAVFLHWLNAIFLYHRCHTIVSNESTTLQDEGLLLRDRSLEMSSCDDDVVESIKAYGFAVRNITRNGIFLTANITLVLSRDAIASASLVQGFAFYPLIILYIFLTQQQFSRSLFIVAELVQTIALFTLLMLTLSYSIMYAYVLSVCMLVQQITSPMEIAVSIFMCIVFWSTYIIYIVAATNSDSPHRLFILDEFLSHGLEKQTPIVFVALFAGYIMDTNNRGMYLKTESIKKQRKAIQSEQEKNKELLSLPKIILEGLQQNEGKAPVIDAYGTVLYADIVSFTVFSGQMEAFRLVTILDDMFEMHDDLALKLGVDKVKTLGDCYVACTGVLSPIANHAATMVKFGLGMHLVMKRLNDKFDLHGHGPKGKDLRIRVGIASGAVVGGVVGGKKFIFDLWGDVVENAELMESGGVPERVQVSQSTYLRSMKDQNLSFKSRPERVPGAKYTSYLVDIPAEGIEQFIARLTGDKELKRIKTKSSNRKRDRTKSLENGSETFKVSEALMSQQVESKLTDTVDKDSDLLPQKNEFAQNASKGRGSHLELCALRDSELIEINSDETIHAKNNADEASPDNFTGDADISEADPEPFRTASSSIKSDRPEEAKSESRANIQNNEEVDYERSAESVIMEPQPPDFIPPPPSVEPSILREEKSESQSNASKDENVDGAGSSQESFAVSVESSSPDFVPPPPSIEPSILSEEKSESQSNASKDENVDGAGSSQESFAVSVESSSPDF